MKKYIYFGLGLFFLLNLNFEAYGLPDKTKLVYEEEITFDIKKTFESINKITLSYSNKEIRNESITLRDKKELKDDGPLELYNKKKNFIYLLKSDKPEYKVYDLYENIPDKNVELHIFPTLRLKASMLENKKQLINYLEKKRNVKTSKDKYMNFDCDVFSWKKKFKSKIDKKLIIEEYTKVWLSKELNFPVKVEYRNIQGKNESRIIKRLLDVKKNVSFPADEFKIPNGYKMTNKKQNLSDYTNYINLMENNEYFDEIIEK